MKKKIKNSVSAKTFLIIATLLIVCCTIIYGLVIYSLPKIYQSELESQFSKEFQKLVTNLEKNSLEDMTSSITDFSIRNSATITITDDKGEKILSIKSINESNDTKNSRTLTVSSGFTNSDKIYHLAATANFAVVNQALQILVRLLPVIIFAVLLISTAGAVFVSRYFSKPLIDISEVSKKMAMLDMTWKCETKRTDEIGILANNLNDMSEQLHKNLLALKRANLKLQEDIIRERKLEKQRLDFFTVVSHELKTPITIIKGELQGMICNVGEYQNHTKYLRHVLKTTNNMEKLVQEILSASKMESEDFKLNMETINISDLIKKIIHEVQGLAEDKEMILDYDIQNHVIYAGDYQLLKKAFSNIIGNAIFHSPSKAEINIILKDNIFLVLNKGTYIDNEDIEQLFIPFYRVDKSHNSNTGGSGFGLYIVKTIFEQHKIKYQIENTEDGVLFTSQF